MPRLYILPSGRSLPVVICSKTVYLRGRRTSTERWFGRLEKFDGVPIGVYAESGDSLWLYTALSGMWGKPSTGGLLANLNRARDASVAYEVSWLEQGLVVALGDKDPAFEGGLGALEEVERQWRRGEISIPPAVVRKREIFASFPDVDAILLPASPIESNAMRLSLARVLLIRPEVIGMTPEPEPSNLESPKRLLPRLIVHRAPDRMASLEDPPGRKLWTAPRLGYFLFRRAVARVKDGVRRVMVEKPLESIASVRDFVADLPISSLAELLKAFGALCRSLLEGWARLLTGLAVLIAALAKIGLF